MKKKTQMCYYCGKHPVTIVDYRDFNGCVGRYLSCKWCRFLNNKAIRRVENEGLDPKIFYKTNKKI